MNKNELTTEQLVLIVFIMMLLINGLMSCTSSRAVYQQDQEGIVWKIGPKVSTVTGYKYKYKINGTRQNTTRTFTLTKNY
jgi:hypothetical protein